MTDALTSLLRHPLLSEDAKEACAAIDAIKTRRIGEVIQYLGLTDKSKEFLSNISTNKLIDTGIVEAKASLVNEESRLKAIVEQTASPEHQELLDLVVECRKSCRTIMNQLRGRITTRHIDKRCTSAGFEPPHEWLESVGVDLLLKATRRTRKTRRWIDIVISVFRVERLTLAALESAIVAATRLMRLAIKKGIEYCFLQLELCRMMCQLLVVSVARLDQPDCDAVKINQTKNFVWNPDNIPFLYPQLRFHDNHAITRIVDWFGFLFDNPRDWDPQPAEDHVAQLFKKAVPHKHQPHHFLPVTITWAREDGYNPARKLLIEIMTFFWIGAYPYCSPRSRLTRDDDLLYLYSTRANTRYVDTDRVVDELQKVSGLHAVKEYLNHLIDRTPVLSVLSDKWSEYATGVRETCENLRRVRCRRAKTGFREDEQKAFDAMSVARSKMTAIGASIRIRNNFLIYINRHIKIKEWDDNVLAVDSKTPDIDSVVRTILDAPDISFCEQVSGFIFYDEAVDRLAQSSAFAVQISPEVVDFRRRDRACMMRLLTVLCIWFRIKYDDFCWIRSIVDVYYSGNRGASSYSVQFNRHFKDNPRLKSVVAAMGFVWVNLTAVTYVRLPANLNAHVEEAVINRSKSLVGDDTLAKLDGFWLYLYCGVCNCSHSLSNSYPRIGGAKVEGYHGHADAGFGRGIRIDLLSGRADCDRTGSRIAFQCASAHCLSVSIRNCVINWSRSRGFVCSCCGILATWCPVFGTSWSKGYLCSRCSVIIPDRLDAIANGLKIARGGPAGSLRLKGRARADKSLM